MGLRDRRLILFFRAFILWNNLLVGSWFVRECYGHSLSEIDSGIDISVVCHCNFSRNFYHFYKTLLLNLLLHRLQIH